jgi:hypothetical protein
MCLSNKMFQNRTTCTHITTECVFQVRRTWMLFQGYRLDTLICGNLLRVQLLYNTVIETLCQLLRCRHKLLFSWLEISSLALQLATYGYIWRNKGTTRYASMLCRFRGLLKTGCAQSVIGLLKALMNGPETQ